MDLYTGTGHDHDHQLDANGAYEWWYVDALSADGEWGVVVADHCGYAVSVYHRTDRVAFAFREVDANEFVVPDTVFEVDTTHPDLPQSIHVRIEVGDSPLQDAGSPTGDHGWVLVAPRAEASVSLSLAENGVVMVKAGWSGLAYRDHNFGSRPLHDDFGDWFWGRVHAPDRTLVFLATPDAASPVIYCGEVGEDRHSLRGRTSGSRSTACAHPSWG